MSIETVQKVCTVRGRIVRISSGINLRYLSHDTGLGDQVPFTNEAAELILKDIPVDHTITIMDDTLVEKTIRTHSIEGYKVGNVVQLEVTPEFHEGIVLLDDVLETED